MDKPLEAVNFAETLTKQIIPSTKPVFNRYWSGDIAKNAFTGPTGVTSKKFWTHPKKGTVMRLVKNPKTGKYENVYEEPCLAFNHHLSNSCFASQQLTKLFGRC